jgi:hypothetical protein
VIRGVAAFALVLALFLPGCGDDSSGGEVGRTQPTTTTEQSGDRPSGKEERRRTTRRTDVPKVQLDQQQEPVPEDPVLPEERSGTPPRYTRPKRLPKEQLKAIERPVYEQTRYLCRRLGVEGMRREYRIESSDPQGVARAVAANTYQREIRDAVYSGCLAGLDAGQ